MSGTTWQPVYTQQYDIMERMAVDGGWLYRNRLVVQSTSQQSSGYLWAVTMAFVPEPPPPLEEETEEEPEEETPEEPDETPEEDDEPGAAA